VLVIEDDPQMRRFLRASLTANGYRTIEAKDGRDALALAGTHNPEIVLLDLGLPDRDGVDVTRGLREVVRASILVVSARGREDDKVAALDAGADDYLTKPFGVRELLARMRVALRHGHERDGSMSELVLGELRVDFDRRRVFCDDQEVHLTPLEYRLLALLAQNLGRVLTHAHILREVWGPAYVSHTHYVRVHMAELRKKIERQPARPKLLVTEPGVGYRLREPPAPEGVRSRS
jgi:two-component system KDP operon response regulator KdpE